MGKRGRDGKESMRVGADLASLPGLCGCLPVFDHAGLPLLELSHGQFGRRRFTGDRLFDIAKRCGVQHWATLEDI